MNAIELKKRAQKLTIKVNALGFTKEGKPMVLDQAYELVAAEEGFRNQHALRAELKPVPPEGQGPWTFGDGVVCNTQEELDAYLEGVNPPDKRIQQLESALRAMVEQADEDCPSEYRSRHFRTAMTAALSLLENKEATATTPSEPTLPLELALLEARWGAEHEYYNREDWQQDVSNGDTKRGYWEWVYASIEANNGDEAHCTKCGCPDADDGEGENGLCGDCADRAYNEENPDEADEAEPVDIENLADVLKLDLDDAKFWVGLHYKVNFDAEPNKRQVDWLNRYREAHGLPPVTPEQIARTAADLAYEAYDFGEHLVVADDSGWEFSTGDSLWTKSVFLADDRTPDAPTKLVKFVVDIRNGVVVNVSLQRP